MAYHSYDRWLFTPRGCAILHVPKRNQHLIRTSLPTSHGFSPLPWTARNIRENLKRDPQHNAFEALFNWVATSDDSAYLCIPAAIEFRQTRCGGEEKIASYCNGLAYEAGNRLADILGTQVLSEAGVDRNKQCASQLRQCPFANVQLPIGLKETSSESKYSASIKKDDVNAVARWMEKELVFRHKTFVPVFLEGDNMWVRLSAQIYLEMFDFEWLGDVLKGLVERVGSGEYQQ